MIRILIADDYESYKKLRLASLKNDAVAFISTIDFEKDKPDTYFKNKLLNSIQLPIWGMYGYFQNKKLIATSQITNSYLPKKRHTAYIFEVYVLPEYRRKKIATKLVKYLIEKITTDKEVQRIELKVNSKNTPALSFYKTLGFKRVAVIKNAIKEFDGSYQDEHIFNKILQKS